MADQTQKTDAQKMFDTRMNVARATLEDIMIALDELEEQQYDNPQSWGIVAMLNRLQEKLEEVRSEAEGFLG